ncbi:integrase [Streptosporangium becharense]|uniref:Integrase n=1 Tax=Streptosporangium becharense TaxID=1816182 RepID=A0A7W9MGE2_9ACTN|nr:integrase [Streptosporangium becharense]MBB5819760.1 integrase [Streptosporangium becharense]
MSVRTPESLEPAAWTHRTQPAPHGPDTRTRWADVVKKMGLPGLHFHDLRHPGNMLAAESDAGLKDLMARTGHDDVRRDDLPARRTGRRPVDHGRDRSETRRS